MLLHSEIKEMARFKLRAILLTFVFLLLTDAHAANVIYVGSSNSDETLRQVRAAADIYGLDVISIRPGKEAKDLLHCIRDPQTVAVVLDASALSVVARSQLLAAGISSRNVPILIGGIDMTADLTSLEAWSDGKVTGVGQFDAGSNGGSYTVGAAPAITHEINGIRLPLPLRVGPYLKVVGNPETLLRVNVGNAEFPVFVRVVHAGEDVFFAAKGSPAEVPVTADPHRQLTAFASLAPEMMFLRYAAGDKAWHAPGSYANLTIDDTWLREPYGFVDYHDLLREMEQHKFHTTIAFIPWNYDRSEPAVVSLFAAHPDLFSICIHGNNHVHQEFGPLDGHPISKQTTDMRQAVARMEKFRALTGIPFDRVMVFPHSVAPLETFAELKRANYLATANSLNTPSNADPTNKLDIALRTTTLYYANFPSMRRYSAEVDVPVSQIATDMFLGNSTLFYVHQAFFADGIGRFDQTADTVNRLQPATRWRSLGYIATHSYLLRTVNDDARDIKLFTAAANIHNPEDHTVVYSIQKSEDYSLPVTVLVDGRSVQYERKEGMLRLQLPIEAGRSRDIVIQYGDPLNSAAIDIGKGSLSVAMIRHLSDFRDDVVSRSPTGRRFIRFYVQGESRWNLIAVAVIVVIAAFLILIRITRRRVQPASRSPLVDRQ
jgi:peptidoglycan/xylan/chitin deacetylase (PgdA/CDA1 family)